MQFGVQIGNLEWPQLRDLAQKIEGLGFDSVMMPDHIVHEGPEKQHDPTARSFDPILQVGMIAAATKKIRLGHLVLCNLFRHPVFTAQAIMSLDHLSGGRAFLGLGTGWTETEFRMTGIAFPDIATRLRMLDEALTCIRSLWTQEHTTFHGEFYHFDDAILFPKPVQKPQPPIVLGGGGKGLLRLAAKHADVLNIISDVGKVGYIALEKTRTFDDAAFKSKVGFVREEAARRGRDPKSIEISQVIFTTLLTNSADESQAMAQNFAGMFGASPEEIRHSPLFLIGTPDEVVAELKRRERDWSLSEVVFSGIADGGAQLERLSKEVVARLR